MPVVRLICYLLATACFVVAAVGHLAPKAATPKAGLVPAGLAFWVVPALLSAVYAVD